MKRAFNIVCRGSWLSLAQAEIFKKKVLQYYPGVTLNIVIKQTAGDKNQSTPLHLVEGKDFFTKEIQESLRNGEADFALHSMKDVSSEDFFQNSEYAIIERDHLNDVAIFNADVLEKLKNGNKIVIGTSSPRRTNMATAFLQKALPQYGDTEIEIEAIPVRGNVDTRLKKLNEGQYDGLILAIAGLNRLLRYDASKETVQGLLSGKKIMVLPLFECPPAAGQGAIVAETTADNYPAIELLQKIKDAQLTKAIEQEREYAYRYGFGCSQQFGVFHLDLPGISFTYASGKDRDAEAFTEWDFKVELDADDKQIFSSAEYMKEFFEYEFLNDAAINEKTEAVFVASHKAVHSASIKRAIEHKRVWVAGTKTWFSLAKQDIWVEGCADGIGLEWLQSLWNTPLNSIEKNDVLILTNTKSSLNWKKDGWKATGSYQLIPVFSKTIADEIAKADILFWTSFQQYTQYKLFVKENAVQCCPAGKTVQLLIKEGIQPIVFPGIKAFNEWRVKYTIVTEKG
ncbi:MAG: hydroxymethylbilane synthase [Parafilimonas sp.]